MLCVKGVRCMQLAALYISAVVKWGACHPYCTYCTGTVTPSAHSAPQCNVVFSSSQCAVTVRYSQFNYSLVTWDSVQSVASDSA